jgi:DNA polymerase II small subunit
MRLGLQIAPDALDHLMSMTAPDEAIEELVRKTNLQQHPTVISLEYLTALLEGRLPKSQTSAKTRIDQIIEQREQDQVEVVEESQFHTIDIIKNPNKESVASEGTVEDFLALFNDRFRRIKQIYMRRVDTRDAVSLSTLRERRSDSRQRELLAKEGVRSRRPQAQKAIGIVKNKSISRSRNVIVELEDAESSILCVIPSSRTGLKGKELAHKGNSILLDEVICVSGRVDQDARMIADDVIFPDIPSARSPGRASRDIYAAFISDLHCGSKEFLEDEFDRFIEWISGRDPLPSEKDLVSKIRYLFIAGDLVDGVGVYPSQEPDLSITSIYDQYETLAEKLSQIPEHIKILCIPGNHDACRQALPKPPIPEDFAASLYGLGDRMIMLGDPSQVRIEGVNILITHGDSLDDLVTNIPGASYADPATPMKNLLKKRHLVPLYGGKTELAPLHRDWMVIDTPPDVVHFGHAHHYAVDNYRGVQIVNSGTFQSQTEFMRKQGIEPTPGMVTILNLRSGAPTLKFFYDIDRFKGSSNN